MLSNAVLHACVMSPELSRPTQSSARERGSSSAPIAILLCTYNGARFLPAQLASYEAQDSDWRLFVSDDGSTDDTPALLADFQKKHGDARVWIRPGPRRGFVANFLSLVCDPEIGGEYYALSDQDDVWDADKLARARKILRNTAGSEPLVYCSRTRLIDEHGRQLRLSLNYRRPPHFRNALAQSLASGNTMVLNEPTKQLLMRAGADVGAPAHDWWIYLLVTAVGGRMLYDQTPTVSYRMHGRNVIGSNSSAAAQIRRAAMLWQGRYKGWAELNVTALERIENEMTAENRRTFDLYRRSRKRSLVPRMSGLIRSGVYRQTVLGDIGLVAAALAGKV
jgi:glycosyltransferase involved in cell wall biosynthesis